MGGILAEGGGESRLESCGAVCIEQREEPSGERAQMHAAASGKLKEARGARGRIMQPVDCPMRARGTLLGLEGCDVRGLLDLRLPIVASRVGGDEGGAIEDAHGIDRGEYLEGAAH